MTTTVLEIVDSAVKIGLGALITATASYLTLRRTQRHETTKVLREARSSLFREIALLTESSVSTLNLFVISVISSGVKPDDLKNIVAANSKAGQAFALASLAGSPEVSGELDKLDKHITELYAYVRDAPSGVIEAPNDLARKITATANAVFACLKTAQEANLLDA